MLLDVVDGASKIRVHLERAGKPIIAYIQALPQRCHNKLVIVVNALSLIHQLLETDVDMRSLFSVELQLEHVVVAGPPDEQVDVDLHVLAGVVGKFVGFNDQLDAGVAGSLR